MFLMVKWLSSLASIPLALLSLMLQSCTYALQLTPSRSAKRETPFPAQLCTVVFLTVSVPPSELMPVPVSLFTSQAAMSSTPPCREQRSLARTNASYCVSYKDFFGMVQSYTVWTRWATAPDCGVSRFWRNLPYQLAGLSLLSGN